MVFLRTFFNCMELRSGAFLVGWFTIIFGIIIYCIININEAFFYICFITITILSGFSLIWGSLKEKVFFVILWLITNALGYFLICIFSFLRLYAIYTCDPELAAILFGVTLLIMGLYIYMWLCVFSYYQKLNEDLQKIQNRQNVVYIPSAPVDDTVASELIEDKPPQYDSLQFA